jgi:hypothetical protein
MAYDAARARVVLFGGSAGADETWEWDGTNWTERRPAEKPLPRGSHAMTFDSARNRVVLFGGDPGSRSDTWEYGPVNPASYSVFGTGCRGTAGVPDLAPADAQRPWLGGSFTLRVANVPANQPVLVLLGQSRTSWGQITLPMDLTPLGLSGCALQVDGLFVMLATPQSGTARLVLNLPFSAELLRAVFHNQAFVYDPGANPAGKTMSNGGTGVLGAR